MKKKLTVNTLALGNIKNRKNRSKFLIKEVRKMTEYKDKTIKCVDCGTEFVFTARDQEFYQEKGFTNEPKRCKACRDKRKAEKNNFKKESNN